MRFSVLVEHWALGYHSMIIRGFSDISYFPKILSPKLLSFLATPEASRIYHGYK